MALDINRPDLVVGVVGTGAMGRGIAQVTAQGGMKAVMFDAQAGGAAKAKAAILETLKGLIAAARELGLSITDEEAFLREQQRRVFEWAKPMGGSAGRNTRLP